VDPSDLVNPAGQAIMTQACSRGLDQGRASSSAIAIAAISSEASV
jgi:hypothetical protein